MDVELKAMIIGSYQEDGNLILADYLDDYVRPDDRATHHIRHRSLETYNPCMKFWSDFISNEYQDQIECTSMVLGIPIALRCNFLSWIKHGESLCELFKLKTVRLKDQPFAKLIYSNPKRRNYKFQIPGLPNIIKHSYPNLESYYIIGVLRDKFKISFDYSGYIDYSDYMD